MILCETKKHSFISSKQNPKIKNVSKLKMKKYRDQTQQMLVEGHYLLSSVLQNDYKVTEFFFCPPLFSDKFDNANLIDKFEQKGVPIHEVTTSVFEKIGATDNPSGLLAVVEQKRAYLKDYQAVKNGFYIAVESIEQPHNLGAILRLADNAGADAVLVCDMRADLYNPEAIRSSFGALFCMDILLCSTTDAIKWCHDNNIGILATSPNAQTLYTNTDMTKPTIIVLGAEHGGLDSAWLEKATTTIKIPMLGQANSLSVSASTAIVLYEALRQRSMLE